MIIKQLAKSNYSVVGIVENGQCNAELFITEGEETYRASRNGLLIMIQHIAEHGLTNIPASWMKLVSKEERIYELRKGDLRLFFFQGEDGQIAVCSSGLIKKTQKVDTPSVTAAAKLRKEYFNAVAIKILKVI